MDIPIILENQKMRFRLVLHDTQDENKFMADRRHEFLGDRDAIWFLWYTLAKVGGKKHVEVFNLAGDKQEPEKGSSRLQDFNV